MNEIVSEVKIPSMTFGYDANPVAIVDKAASHETAMRMCLGWLVNHADVLVKLPGYELSQGAWVECKVADACGIESVQLIDLMAETSR